MAKEEKPASTVNIPREQTSTEAASTASTNLIETTTTDNVKLQSNLDDLLGICDEIDGGSSASASLLHLFDQSDLLSSSSTEPPNHTKSTSAFTFDLFSKLNKSVSTNKANATPGTGAAATATPKPPSKADKKASAWFDLFADLDPLANPAAMEQKIASANKNYLDA